MESIIKSSRNPIFLKKSCLRKIILASGQPNFLPVETIFLSIFQRFVPIKYFSTKFFIRLVKTDFLASGNCFVLFAGFSSQWKPSLKLVEANCERKSILNPFSFILSDNSQLLPVGTVHSSTGTCFSQSFIPASENEFFVYWKQYCFTLEFFLLVETIVEIWRKSIFKDETYSCW